MSRFSHLILTPFNIRVAGAPGLDEGWLDDRFRLFENFCYPSVQAQTCRNFRWLVFLDVDTPARYKRRIGELGRDGTLEPVYILGMQDYREATLRSIATDSTHLITTTLDNDDAIATTLVERIQAEFREQDFQFINFVNGFRLDLKKRRLYAHHIQANPFISLIETNRDVKTMRGCGPHNQLMSRFDRIHDVESEPLWLQVVHGGNIAITGMWGCRRVPMAELNNKFELGCKLGTAGEKMLSIRIENLRRRVERVFIDRLGRRGDAAARRALKAIRRFRRGVS